jgi:predicted nucleic acid-binding protein
VSWLLDTCVLSELVKPRPDARVVQWMDAREEDSLFVSVVTLGELAKGVEKLPPSERRETLQGWLDWDLPERFAGRLLPVDASVALAWGRMMAEAEARGRAMPVLDALLAATAATRRLVLVTRNLTHFEGCGVKVLNPWS